ARRRCWGGRSPARLQDFVADSEIVAGPTRAPARVRWVEQGRRKCWGWRLGDRHGDGHGRDVHRAADHHSVQQGAADVQLRATVSFLSPVMRVVMAANGTIWPTAAPRPWCCPGYRRPDPVADRT